MKIVGNEIRSVVLVERKRVTRAQLVLVSKLPAEISCLKIYLGFAISLSRFPISPLASSSTCTTTAQLYITATKERVKVEILQQCMWCICWQGLKHDEKYKE